LENLGYHVLEAASGPEAIEVWKRHSTRIHLLFTDLVMPGGLNGRELYERLRQEQPELKVIFSSGYSPDSGGPDSNGGAGILYLQKPYRPPALGQAVRRCLDTPAVAAH
jgi:CheY-like chemotaxis protein